MKKLYGTKPDEPNIGGTKIEAIIVILLAVILMLCLISISIRSLF